MLERRNEMSKQETDADLIKPKGIYCYGSCPSFSGTGCKGGKPFSVCLPLVSALRTTLKQVARYCKMVAEDGTPGDYGCGMESTAIAVLDILDENNITMEQLK